MALGEMRENPLAAGLAELPAEGTALEEAADRSEVGLAIPIANQKARVLAHHHLGARVVERGHARLRETHRLHIHKTKTLAAARHREHRAASITLAKLGVGDLAPELYRARLN